VTLNGVARGIQIGRVARETGLTVDAIRFYEKQRLLRPAPRSEGGYRLFSGQDLQHIQFIRRAQGLGFSLTEIRELMILQGEQVEACSHVRDMLMAKLVAVRRKISELRGLENHLAADLKQCERRLRAQAKSHDICPVLEAIAAPPRRKPIR
jgi:MerR family copper efflux transcriptional regulator